MADEVTPFRVEVAEADLRDLRRRLEGARWPEAETVPDLSQGVPLAYLRELCGYWARGYDWRATDSSTSARRGPTRCRWSSPTAGPARSWSS
jgi:hypothetical protein